jgi:methionyl-tRNA formyltransferase
MRLVFAGTPATAVPTLEALLKSRHAVQAVITRPDAKSGRGQQMAASPVAARAAEAGIEVLRPPRPGDPEFLARLRQIGPDCCPVTAYGALIPQEALDIPVHGWVNLHFSVLPAWRGAAPVQHAILHGDDVTGATTFRIVRELDAGPVFGVLTEAIRPSDTAGDLLDRLALAGADLMVATLDGIESGELEARDQPSHGVSRAPKITPADAEINWLQPAVAIGRVIRACTPQPGAWTQLSGARIKVWPVTPRDADHGEGAAPLEPGELRTQRDRVLVGTATVPVELGDVQPHGKRRMPAADWARGLRLGSRPAVLG